MPGKGKIACERIVAAAQGGRRKFPSQRNGELFQRSKEFWGGSRKIYKGIKEFKLPNSKSWPK
jgi:hypothetical protein